MAIKKKGTNRWQVFVSVRIPGRKEPVRRQVTINGTKADAQIRKASLIDEIRNGSQRSLKSNVTEIFSDAVEIFIEKRGPFSKSHEQKINYLKKELGDTSMDVLPDAFENWLRILKNTPTIYGKPRSSASMNRYVEIVRAVHGLLVELGTLDSNPITKARFPKGKEKPRDRYLSHDERIRLLNAIRENRPYILPIVQYMLLVPCRKSELTSARREQYNAFDATIYIPDSKADIPIYKPVPDEMRRYFDSIPTECPWLFYRQDKDGSFHALGTLQKPWAFCLKKAGLLNVRIHDLRHISATDLYEAGNPERVIMDICGWKTPMLSTYRHKDSYRSAKAIRFSRHNADTKSTQLQSNG